METPGTQPNPEDFDRLAVIGRGCNGTCTVSVAVYKPTRTHVALKCVNLENSSIDLSALQHEVSQHNLLNHTNVLPTQWSFVHNKELWIVSPLAGFGSCRDLLQAHFHHGLPEACIAYVLRDVLQALEYLHRRGIIHRSIKASHILVSSLGNVMLSGLRYSINMVDTGKRARSIYSFPSNYISSLLWASPELLEQNLTGYDTKSDIYSLGIAACELANGVAPFSDLPATQMLLAKIQGVKPALIDSSSLGDCADLNVGDQDKPESNPFRRTFSPHFHNFVEACLHTDPGMRPPAAALIQHAFFKQIRRKSNMDSLPTLLQPVQPLTAVELPPDPSIDQLTEDLATVSMECDMWDF